MRTQHLRSHMWAVLAATAISFGVAAEASAQFNIRSHGFGNMRGQGAMKPVTMRPPTVKPPTIKVPGSRGPVTSIRPPREPSRVHGGGHPPRGPVVTHYPPRFPPVVIGPGFVPPMVVEPPPPGVIGPPGPPPVPPGVGGNPPPRQTAQPPQPPQQSPRTASGVPPANERRYVPDEVVIEVASGLPAQQAQALAQRLRLVQLESFSLGLSNTTIFRWRIPDRRSVPAVIRALEADGSGSVRNAQPNYLFKLSQDVKPQPAALTTSTGESIRLQYALGKLKLEQAHSIAKGDKILVAVIDSGVDADHPELAGMVADQLDAVGGPGPKAHSHGTGIAGTIVAQAKMRGVAPSARVLAVRAFGGPTGDGDATTYAILKGLDWAHVKGARVVNMSFAGPQDPAISRSIAAAREKGMVLVAAAGNEGPRSAPLYPAADPNVIAVTATDAQDRLFARANRGKHIAVAAPGVDILLPIPNGAYNVSSGTSFSAAFVTGTVALMFERKPDLSPDDVRRVLTATATDLGPKGIDDQFGAGLVDAYGAVSSVAPLPERETATAIPAAVR